MTGPGRGVQDLAQAVVDSLTAPAAEEGQHLEAAERLFGALQDELIELVGATGFHALLDRSFHRAASEHGITIRTRPPRHSGDFLRELRDSIDALPPQDVYTTLVAVLAELLALLARLIGGDMTARVVHRTWPGIAPWLTAGDLEAGDG